MLASTNALAYFCSDVIDEAKSVSASITGWDWPGQLREAVLGRVGDGGRLTEGQVPQETGRVAAAGEPDDGRTTEAARGIPAEPRPERGTEKS